MRQTLKANLFERTFLSPLYREAYQGMITRPKVVHLLYKKYFLPYLTINETLKSMRLFCTKKIR